MVLFGHRSWRPQLLQLKPKLNPRKMFLVKRMRIGSQQQSPCDPLLWRCIDSVGVGLEAMYSYDLLVLLLFFCSVIEVNSIQTFLYISFMDQTLVNHDYVDLNGGNDVLCITDLTTCCSASQGPHRGNWHFPNETRLSLPTSDTDIFESRGSLSVSLRRNSGTSPPNGIYHCLIPTKAVNDVSGNTSVGK